ncbi:hypothetical protein F5876DRAFT_73498 [Lentinula aff. lateritia]|uniref:Uncharacterized protein n=1 Tax=Lentinula aff. lateritia TaxID=2804960 RepID=A0ACC1UA14_9AGAR|nr:hypothetical protein F5876DRAFT_73498 [Lentinula aff. lateritia]
MSVPSSPDSSVLDTQICKSTSGDPEAPQCLQVFDFKTEAGSCARCIYASGAPSSEEQSRRLGLPYCHGCASIVRFMTGSHCGWLHHKATYFGKCWQLDFHIPDINSLSIGQWWHIHGSSIGHSLKPVKSDAADLARIRVIVYPAVAKGNRIVEVLNLGSYDKTPREDEMFEDAICDTNSEWENGSNESLQRSDVTPRWWGGNTSVLPESTSGTLGQFYQMHAQQPNPAPYMQYPTNCMGKAFSAKSCYIVLYLVIRVVDYESRAGSTAPNYVPGSSAQAGARKRARGSNDQSGCNVSVTMPSMRAPLVSQFSTTLTRNSCSYLRIAKICSNIEMFKSIETEIVWDNNKDAVRAKLDNVPFGSGNIKQVYGLVFEESPHNLYVAKCMFQRQSALESTSQSNMVPMIDNRREMELEVKRNCLIKFFLDWFFMAVKIMQPV